MPNIVTKIESARGCGYRKKGGIYLVSDGISAPCHKLPIPLTVCPCCNAGIKQARGFTWISGLFITQAPCNGQLKMECNGCPANIDLEKIGLLWVGEKFYPSSEHFTKEANAMGVSKRIGQVPRDFEVGKTWVALAHPKAVSSINDKGELTQGPGIFRMFKPQRIEYVVKGDETDEQLEKLTDRGFTLINVIPDKDAQRSLEI